jgi:hypothetical protein
MFRLVRTSTLRRLRADQAAARQMAGTLITARTCADRIHAALWRLKIDPIEGRHFDAACERSDDLRMALIDYGAPVSQRYVYPEGHPLREVVGC